WRFPCRWRSVRRGVGLDGGDADDRDHRGTLRCAARSAGCRPGTTRHTRGGGGHHPRSAGMTVDVLVLGAGSAGLAAAVTAARSGVRVAVVERHGFAGGMGTASLVHTFCGLYLMGDGPPVIANPGFSGEIADRMIQATGAAGPVRMGRVWVLRQHPVDFARIA